jgi:UDP-N-acetylglucosamine--N-acetylmuramyl-(pentapeptide) pyrophosphoryl-undecaprenol N-acetylglucosamine transferase
VGLGGYSSFAPVLAASHLGLPTVLLEQNAVVGKANLRLARRASLVCLSWEASRASLPRRARGELTGNPVRREIVDAAAAAAYQPGGAVLILGGSTGAMGLNSMIIAAVKELGALGREIIHQAGSTDFERVRAAYRDASVEARVEPFIHDMPSAYGKASLVIARAGGTTLSEIALFGIPAVLVPYPHHRDNHQKANAEIFAAAGAAGIIDQGDGAAALADLAGQLAGSPERLERMHAASLSLGRPDAADAAAAAILRLVEADARR